jgi:hypothetical protein
VEHQVYQNDGHTTTSATDAASATGSSGTTSTSKSPVPWHLLCLFCHYPAACVCHKQYTPTEHNLTMMQILTMKMMVMMLLTQYHNYDTEDAASRLGRFVKKDGHAFCERAQAESAPRWPNMHPTWLQNASSWPQHCPTCPKVASTWPQHGFKIAQYGSKWLQAGRRRSREGPRWPQHGHKRGPRYALDGLRRPEDGSRWPRTGTR